MADSLPIDSDLYTVDDELSNAFFDDTDFDETEVQEPRPFGRTWQFDLGTGRMVKYGSRPAEITGLDNLRQWIDIAMNVATGVHPIFPEEYGTDNPQIMLGAPYSPALEADYIDQVRKALLFHDRIVSVDNFQFEHGDNDEIVNVSFVVRTDSEDDESLAIEAPYGVNTNG